MRALRYVLAGAMVLGLLNGGAATVRADDTAAADPGPGLQLLKAALEEFRAALVDLKDACAAERVDRVPMVRKRLKVESPCEAELRELRASFAAAREVAHKLEHQYRAERKEQAKRKHEQEEASKAREEATKAAEEAARHEAEQRSKNSAKPQTKPQAKPVAQPADDVAKKRAYLEQTIRQLDEKIAYKLSESARYAVAAREYGARAATLSGAERDRFLAKAAQAEKDAATWAQYAKEYQAERVRAIELLAKLGTGTAPDVAALPPG